MPNVSRTNLQHQSPDCVVMLHQHLPCNTTNPNNNWPLGHHLARPFKPFRFKPSTQQTCAEDYNLYEQFYSSTERLHYTTPFIYAVGFTVWKCKITVIKLRKGATSMKDQDTQEVKLVYISWSDVYVYNNCDKTEKRYYLSEIKTHKKLKLFTLVYLMYKTISMPFYFFGNSVLPLPDIKPET